MVLDVIAGSLLALIIGIGVGLAAGIAGGNMKLGVYWGLIMFVYLTIESQHDWLTGVFVAVMIFIALAVASYLLSYFFATADGGGH